MGKWMNGPETLVVTILNVLGKSKAEAALPYKRFLFSAVRKEQLYLSRGNQPYALATFKYDSHPWGCDSSSRKDEGLMGKPCGSREKRFIHKSHRHTHSQTQTLTQTNT